MTLKVFKLTTNLLELTSNLLGLTMTPCPPGELVDADSNSEVIKGQANRPGGWLHAPAYLELFAAAEERPTVRVKSAPPYLGNSKGDFPVAFQEAAFCLLYARSMRRSSRAAVQRYSV
jgi:hypothetical protein